MRVIISAGGTGGHIYPALAIINKIKELEPNSEFLYIGTHNRMEKDIVPKTGIPFKSIQIYGFDRKNIFKNFNILRLMIKSYFECKKIIRQFNPDVVIGAGGYVTVPVIYAAKKLHYKTFIHEQNSIPGKANHFLVKYTDLIAVSFKSSIKYFPEYKTIFSGNPCSDAAKLVLPLDKKTFNLDYNKKLILIVMGSLGSAKVNSFLLSQMDMFKNNNYEVLFVTGKDQYDDIIKNNIPSNVKVVPYIDNMTGIMKQADLIISRAGATTLSEIIALNIPSIIIPSPYVPNNHQYKNALDLETKEACILIEEKDLTNEIFKNAIDELLYNEDKILNMKNSMKLINIDGSATIIYDGIKKMIDRK